MEASGGSAAPKAMRKSVASAGAGPVELLERTRHLSALGASLGAVRGDSRGRLVLVGGEANDPVMVLLAVVRLVVLINAPFGAYHCCVTVNG